MRYAVLFMIIFLLAGSGQAQEDPVREPRYAVGGQYTQEVVFDGYVRVREWDMAGDKMSLRDVGMTSYAAMQLWTEMRMRKQGVIRVIYDQYFMRGSATFERDIYYNGTIIDGRSGIDVSPTRYYRVTGMYSGMFFQRNAFELRYMVGLVFDHIVFYLDGKVSPSSPKNEVYEGFGRQAFPYPFTGVRGHFKVGERGKVYFETSGTYIPKFRSFYTEGGKIHLQYSNFLADVRYSRGIKGFELGVGAKFRHMKLFQESEEDTNELWTLTGGPYVDVAYHF